MTVSRRTLLGWLATTVPATSLSMAALLTTGCSQRNGTLLLGGGRFVQPDANGSD